MFIFTLHARWCDGGPWEALSQSCRFDPGIYSAASPRGAAGGKQQNKSIYCSLINKIAPSDTLSETRFCFVVFFFLLQLFDIERAQLYLSVLQQLEVVYASAPQHRRSVLQTCLPKLINHSLKLLQEPSQQVWRDTLKLQTPGRNFHKSDWQLNYFGADCSLFFIRSSLWETRWLELLLWRLWRWYAVSWSRRRFPCNNQRRWQPWNQSTTSSAPHCHLPPKVWDLLEAWTNIWKDLQWKVVWGQC